MDCGSTGYVREPNLDVETRLGLDLDLGLDPDLDSIALTELCSLFCAIESDTVSLSSLGGFWSSYWNLSPLRHSASITIAIKDPHSTVGVVLSVQKVCYIMH